MEILHPKWSKDVDDFYCTHTSFTKNGRTIYGRQRYKCKDCNRTFIRDYQNKAYDKNTNTHITRLLKEGVGIRSTSRLLRVSKTTVLKRIILIASTVNKPETKPQQTYELDELQTCIGNKENRTWIAYALDRNTRQIIDFNIGRRNNTMLRPVVKTVLASDARQVHTDKLINYCYLLPENIHIMKENGINHIERKNLTLRTHLKRLARKTICYSKSLVILAACVRIYFWG